MLKRAYLEITNVCNRSCAFCPGCGREKGFLSVEEFTLLAKKLREHTEYLYLHVMGEPLLHPQFGEILKASRALGFKTTVTTNGTLLAKQQALLLSSPALHKVNISLHAFEANDLAVPFEKYLADCIAFGQAAKGEKLVVYRLWNQGGADAKNAEKAKSYIVFIAFLRN